MPRPRTRTAPTAPCFATRACAVAQPYIERSGPVAWKIPRKTPPETHCHGRGVCAQALAGQGFGYSTGRSSRPREDLCVPISALLSDLGGSLRRIRIPIATIAAVGRMLLAPL